MGCDTAADCNSPSHAREESTCDNGSCSCLEPLYGTHCDKSLAEEYHWEFLTLMYSFALVHFILSVAIVSNLVSHYRKTPKADRSQSAFSVSVCFLMLGCNALTCCTYLTGLNFDVEYMVQGVPWSVFFFFEGGACALWGIAIAEVIQYWFEVFYTATSAELVQRWRMRIQLPRYLFILTNLIILVLLVVGVIEFETFVWIYVAFEVVLLIMLIIAGRKLLKVIRSMQGGGELVALTTINLCVVLGFYIFYDVIDVLITSNIARIGAKPFLVTEFMSSLLWALSQGTLTEMSFKGLTETPFKLRIVRILNSFLLRCLSESHEMSSEMSDSGMSQSHDFEAHEHSRTSFNPLSVSSFDGRFGGTVFSNANQAAQGGAIIQSEIQEM